TIQEIFRNLECQGRGLLSPGNLNAQIRLVQEQSATVIHRIEFCKTEDTGISEGAQALAAEFGIQHMSAVFNQKEPVLRAKIQIETHRLRESKIMDGDQCTGSTRESQLQIDKIGQPIFGDSIKDRAGSETGNGLRNDFAHVSRNQHFIAVLQLSGG